MPGFWHGIGFYKPIIAFGFTLCHMSLEFCSLPAIIQYHRKIMGLLNIAGSFSIKDDYWSSPCCITSARNFIFLK